MESPPDPLLPFIEGLAECERLLQDGSPDALEGALSLATRLVAGLAGVTSAGDRQLDLMSALLTARGHAERYAGAPLDAVRTYSEALDLHSRDDIDSRSRNRRANLLTCRGLALLDTGEKARLEESLRSFDESISARESDDAGEAGRWGLSAAWLNRADALAGLGGRESLRGAVDSAARARKILEELGPETHPPYRSRLALAWMKSGEYLSRLCTECGETMQDAAIAHHEAAVVVLRPGAEAGIEESRRVLAVALCNLSRARLVLEKRGSPVGEENARESLFWLGDAEMGSPETLHLGLTARISAACHHESASTDDDRFLELTDLAEEALAVAAEGRRCMGPHAVSAALLGELTRLGAHAYLIASPAFLEEFLLETLDPDRSENHFADVAEVHEAAVRVLWRGIAEIQKTGFAKIGSEEYEQQRERLVAWQQCRERLAAIRDRYFTM